MAHVLGGQESGANQQFAVLEMNTLVYGYVNDDNAMPVGNAEIEFVYEDDSGFEIESDAETDEDGYYRAWVHKPWTWDVGIQVEHGSYQWFEDTLNTINAPLDEYEGHYSLYYNPILLHGGTGDQATVSPVVRKVSPLSKQRRNTSNARAVGLPFIGSSSMAPTKPQLRTSMT